MDESGSITTADFTRQKDFVAALANGFNNFGPNGVQMGVITFSTYANVDIKLHQFPNKAAFMNAVRNIRQRGETLLRKKKNSSVFCYYGCHLQFRIRKCSTVSNITERPPFGFEFRVARLFVLLIKQ